jgi:hypothetical protein
LFGEDTVGTLNRAVGASFWIVALILVASAVANDSARAAIKSQTVEYQQGDVTLEGAYVWDDAISAAVLLVEAFSQLHEATLPRQQGFVPSHLETDATVRLSRRRCPAGLGAARQ